MKFKEIEKLIKDRLDLEVVLYLEYPKYDSVRILLPDGGYVSAGIEPKSRNEIAFLWFNMVGTSVRIPSSKGRYKYNYFGEGQEAEFVRLLNELKQVIL